MTTAAGIGKRQPMGRRRLGQLLLERGWISGEQLIRAVQSQRAVGGRIGTCLLEMDAVSEDCLLEALAEQLGVPPVRIEQLRTIAADTLGLVPAPLAARYRTVPFEVSTGELRIAALNVSDLDHLDAIAFCTNKRVRPHIANEARLFEALERFYGVECPQRYGHLLDRLNRTRYLWNVAGDAQPSEPDSDPLGLPSVRWMRADEVFGPLIEPRNEALEPLGDRGSVAAGSVPWSATRPHAEVPERPEPAEPSCREVPPSTEEQGTSAPDSARPDPTLAAPSGRSQPTRVTVAAEDEQDLTAIIDQRVPPLLTPPRSLSEVAGDLASQADPFGVADVLVRFLSGPFVRCGLFRSVRGELRGWNAFGPGLDDERFRSLLIASDRLVDANVSEGAAAVHAIGDLDAEITACWSDAPRDDWLVVPICIKDRVVCAIIGHRDGRPAPPRLLAQLEALAGKAALALELCILRKKILGPEGTETH